MDSADGVPQQFASVIEPLCRDSDIEFVLAFGSRVAENSGPTSDLDLAVKFVEDLSSHERFKKRCFLSGDLQRSDAPFVDIADIERLPLAVAYDVVNGEFLCGDERLFNRFKTEIESKFENRRDDIRHDQRKLIDRIAREGLSG